MLVFTQGFRLSPSSTALRAMRPAPIITDGLEVLVQLVIAAITTVPCVMVNRSPSYSTSALVVPPSAIAATAAGLVPPSSAQRDPFCSAMERFAPFYKEWDQYHGSYRWQSLETAADFVGHNWTGPRHRALPDAQACRAVWLWTERQSVPIPIPQALPRPQPAAVALDSDIPF